MPFHFPHIKKHLKTAFLLCLLFCVGILIGVFSDHPFSENAKFEAFTDEIFKEELSSSALTFHYCVAHPEAEGISRPKAELGTINTDTEKIYALYEKYENKLKSFCVSKLSKENRLTLDSLLLYYHTLLSQKDFRLLEEILSPSLGIQAQLPVLLAEYTFYEEQDITDYLNLLSSIGTYFQSILDFEKEKSAAGYFMSDATLDRICDQCRSFIREPDSNYLLDIFSRKIKDYGKFSGKEQQALNAAHKKILMEQVIPAYQSLIEGLESLRGTGTNAKGLSGFKGGREYYLSLLKSQVGTYMPVKKIQNRLLAQLDADCRNIRMILKDQPSLITSLSSSLPSPSLTPPQMMESLQSCILQDFPKLETVSFEIRYVHKSLEEYLSPAFYLTPPIDTGSPNVIYINNSGKSTNLSLFATLSHEGFPGHLYQTVFFNRTDPADIRQLITCDGYVEGWATYVETYAYNYASSLMKEESASDITALTWLNRSVNLCICSLLDIAIHYHGWDITQTTSFLKAFGIPEKSAAEIFQYIVETPANYLKYYWGYINFLDLRSSEQKRLGDDFDLKDFHRRILEIGPVPFPVLEKYLKEF